MKKYISLLLSFVMMFSVFAVQANVLAAEQQTEEKTYVRGIDVSYFNPNINWSELKADGIEFVFIRAALRGWGEKGVMAKDTMLEKHIKGASEAGLAIGVYFSSQALTPAEAKEEALYLAELVQPYREMITLPVVMDYEFLNVPNGRLYQAWLSGKAGKAEFTANAASFCRAIENEGYQAMIYANKSFYETNLDFSFLEKHFNIWLAHYAEVTDFQGNYNVWQFSDEGELSGVNGKIDLDYLINNSFQTSHFKGWQKLDKTWYYFKASGDLTAGWSKLSDKWYYFNSVGAMQTGWNKIDGKWYYMNGSGVMQTGWQKISKKWYYFNSSGQMQTGWNKIGKKWYYFNSSGVMKTGWLKLSGKWYYLNSDGSMVTGTKKIGNKTYKFNSSGVCQNP